MKKRYIIISLCLLSNVLLGDDNSIEELQDLARYKTVEDPVILIDEQAKIAKLKQPVDPDTNELINRIKKISSLDANFIQTEEELSGHKTSGNKLLKGKVKLAKPDKLLWEITAPEQERQIYITNGANFWHYDKGLAQVVLDKFDSKRIVNSPLYFLLVNVDSLTKNYTVKKVNKDTFELNPNNSAKIESNYTTGLKLQFKTGTTTLTQVSFIAAQNKRVIIDLVNVKINTGVSSAMFNFKVPPGIDVIDAAELY